MDWVQTLTIIASISAVVISVNMITANSLNKRIDDLNKRIDGLENSLNKRIDDLREIVLIIMNHLLPQDVQNPSELKKKKNQ